MAQDETSTPTTGNPNAQADGELSEESLDAVSGGGYYPAGGCIGPTPIDCKPPYEAPLQITSTIE